jgi:hypothetical protein
MWRKPGGRLRAAGDIASMTWNPESSRTLVPRDPPYQAGMYKKGHASRHAFSSCATTLSVLEALLATQSYPKKDSEN